MSHFKNYLEKFDKPINIYIDMDGVVADLDLEGYEVWKNNDDVYLNKRPVVTIINIFKELSEVNNVKLNILSVARHQKQVYGKLEWLDNNMNFIEKDRINILARDMYDFMPNANLKENFLRENINLDEINIMVDDSYDILKTVEKINGVIALHITSILD